MALTPRLELRQGQSLVMTPQLQQAIKLLQLSNLELAEYVDAELERNPLLERDAPGAGEADGAPVEMQGDNFDPAPASDAPLDQTLAREDFGAAGDLDAGRDDLYTDESRAERNAVSNEPGAPLTDWSRVGPGGGGDSDENFEGALARPTTLKDHLEEQLGIAALRADQRFVAVILIEAIDEAGYLRADLTEIAERLGVPREDVETVLRVLQGFDPVGVFARDLAECLAIQLKERDRLDPAMQTMLTRLDLVAKRDMAGLAALCALETSDIADMIVEIRALTPKPGLGFGSEPVQPVIPDVYVREGADGQWHVELNSETLPRVLVNNRYFSEISTAMRSRDDKTYVAECLNTANWLVKSLDQRARTILKVASEIVRQQDSFLTLGVRHLRPINLKIVADAVAMHESTVSRVTSNKYMATPRGLFELKYFFTAAIASMDGSEAHSAEAVRDRIREMIGNEHDDVLSDDRIVNLLSADGVNIARRTVAKYREALHIPSSVERRRMRQLERI